MFLRTEIDFLCEVTGGHIEEEDVISQGDDDLVGAFQGGIIVDDVKGVLGDEGGGWPGVGVDGMYDFARFC